MHSLKELIDSYEFCVNRMNFDSVTPYTETELQPLYSKQWCELLDKMLSVSSPEFIKNISDTTFPNISVLRSMCIMDLFDCAFTMNKDLAHKVFNFYNILLSFRYEEDQFSFEKNIHNSVNLNQTKLIFFDSDTNKKILHWLYNFSYTRWHDIYADNTYEILGPIYTRDYVYIVQDFHNLNQFEFDNETITKLRVVNRYDKFNIYDIKIDMFGHLDFKLYDNSLQPTCAILNQYGKQILQLNLLEEKVNEMYLKVEKIVKKNKLENFQSRYFRYKILFYIFNINTDDDIENIQNALQNKEPEKRLSSADCVQLLRTLI